MRIWFGRLAGLGMMLMLAACNTDALTPQAEVPSAATQTQATATDTQAGVPPAQEQAVASQPVDMAATATNPQNTLQAQAQALQETGVNPVATEPNRVDARNTTIYKNPEVAAVGQSGTIRFLPIIGAPVQAVTPLSRSLGAEARSSGLTIKPSSDTSADHILKGYLSAFNDGEKTTVVYVWDVLDNSGQRLNRLQGQQEVPGPAQDAWSAVPADVMTRIGRETIAAYLAWKQGA